MLIGFTAGIVSIGVNVWRFNLLHHMLGVCHTNFLAGKKEITQGAFQDKKLKNFHS